MMLSTTVKNFHEWREKARLFICNDISPEQIQWFCGHFQQGQLFVNTPLNELTQPVTTFKVSKAFVALAHAVANHRSGEQWALLYQVLWRLRHGEENLLSIVSDTTMKLLIDMQKAISRDVHKMKAFV